jgi:hypothetical protein
MYRPFDELQERFDTMIGLTDENRFLPLLQEYLWFVSETPPFNTIARKVRGSVRVGSDVYFIADGSAKYWTLDRARRALRFFHGYMVEGATELGMTRKKELVLRAKEDSICLLGEKIKCVSFRSRNGEQSKRFGIVKMLLRTKTGKNAREIKNRLRMKGADKIVQDNVKKEIARINKRFKEAIGTDSALIVTAITRGKNIYSLNRESFSFEVESK